MSKSRSKSKKAMKSAYELAMERLAKDAPIVSLTDDQKKELAEVDSTFKAKIAEREVFLKDQIAKAQGAGGLRCKVAVEPQLPFRMRLIRLTAFKSVVVSSVVVS